MPSKLGPHCLRPTGSAKQMMDAGARIVKLVDDFGSAPEFTSRPGVTLIGRSYSNFTAESQRGEDPEAAARRFIDSQKEKYRLNPAVKLWEGHNEPVWGSREDMEWYAKFEIARLKLLADLGLRGVIANFATGNPGDIELWRWFIPAVQAAKQRNGVLGLHEYSSPWVWWMTGKYQFNPNEDAGDEGWTTLRYRKVMHKFLKPAGCDDVQIAITEFGLDRVSPVPQGASTGNWRTNAEWWGRWDGSRDPIPYWRSGNRDAETYYAEQMIWYDREIRKDPNVLGATIFTLGSSNSAWDNYNIDGTRVAQYLTDYIRREANVADSATASTETVTQPTKPDNTSPIVVTGPTNGLNLIRNPNLEEGSYHWHGINEINIPNGWDFWYQTDKQLRLDRQDQAFDPPECVVWSKASAPLEERSLFFLSGDRCMKIFKGWGVIWWRLFQTVDGLVPGQRYRFTAPVFPDLVMKYDLQKGKTFADDPLAGEVRLSAKSGGREVETGWLNGNQFPFGKYTFFTLDFVAQGTSAEISLECRGRWGVVNNGWFLDSLILEAVGPAPVTNETSTQPVSSTSTTQPSNLVMQPKGLNLLQNADFSAGTFQPNPAVRNLEAPRNWEFWSANESTPKIPKQAEIFRPPRAAIVTAANAQVDDRDGLTAGVQRFYRVVGNWRALWFSLSQKVTVLTPNVPHRFSVKLMPDPVDKYLPPNNAKKFVADPDGGEVWLKAQSGSQKTETLKRVNADFQPGSYVTFTHDFTPSAREVTVTIEIRARFPLTQNAWYLASAGLVQLENAPTDGNKTTTDTSRTSTVTTQPAELSRSLVRGPVGRRGISGELRLFVPDKFRYASQIENIKIYELITNTIGQRAAYGVIGVEIVNRTTNEKNFHTSFSGDLHVGPHCTGPKDECGGEWLDQIRIEHAGKYGLALAICYNSVQDALGGRGDWETLTPYIEIEVDNWRP